jgi:uncharacterized protein YecE (DUF72 family)
MSIDSGRVRIGTSGYQYDHWRGVFYPEDLPKRQWFEHYARHFDTVEINASFYRLPETHTFEAWYRQAPRAFLYALKFSRFGSHIKRLRDPEETIGLFLQHASHLGEKLGPVLVQLPPQLKFNPDRLADFLAAAPPEVRWAFEFRSADWFSEETYGLLETHGAALCIHDMLPDHPRRVTTNWTYLRFHGDHYRGSYSPQYLSAQAQRIRDYRHQGLAVYAYFNNDEAGYAVQNALSLRRYVGA